MAAMARRWNKERARKAKKASSNSTKSSNPTVTVDGDQVSVKQPFDLTHGTLVVGPGPEYIPALLHPAATGPRLKVKAARYYLELLKRDIRNEAACIAHADAVVSSLRSATFVMQKLGTKHGEFGDWYAQKVKEMQDDPVLRLAKDLRNEAEKEGLKLARFGAQVTIRVDRRGRVRAEHANPRLRFVGRPDSDPLAEFEQAIERIDKVVEEAHEKGFIELDRRPRMMVAQYLRETKPGVWEPFKPPG